MVEYVVGFAFGRMPQKFSDHVLLLKKNRPKAFAGLLNGVGGKIERLDKTPARAMAREFEEETGLITFEEDWTAFAKLRTGDGKATIHYLYATGVSLSTAKQTTDEEIVVMPVIEIGKNAHRVVRDLKWFVPMAYSASHDDLTGFYDIRFLDLDYECDGKNCPVRAHDHKPL